MKRIAAIGALLLFWVPALMAAEVMASGGFTKLVPGTDKRVAAENVTLADKIYFQILVVADDGDHSLQVNIYEGEGREVYNSESTLTARGGQAGVAVSYSFNAARDAPGLWWYVAAVDGKVVLSKSLEVYR